MLSTMTYEVTPLQSKSSEALNIPMPVIPQCPTHLGLANLKAKPKRVKESKKKSRWTDDDAKLYAQVLYEEENRPGFRKIPSDSISPSSLYIKATSHSTIFDIPMRPVREDKRHRRRFTR